MGTWTHPALRGSGEPAYRNNAVELTAHAHDARCQQDFWLALFPARAFPDGEPLSPRLLQLLLFHAATSEREPGTTVQGNAASSVSTA